MEVAAFFEVRVLAPLLAGLPLIAFAVWIAYLDFESRLHRSLALFLFLRGLANVGTGLLEVPQWHDYWTRLTPYFGVALPLSALHFAYRYVVDRAKAKRREWLVWLFAVVAVGFEILYFLDHANFTARNAQGRVVFGPLFLTVGALYIVYALIANRLTKDYLSAESTKRQPSLLLTALAFALACINTGFYFLLVLLPGPPGLPGSGTSTGAPAPVAAIVAALMLAAAPLFLIPMTLRLIRDRRRTSSARRLTTNVLATMLGPVATAFIAAAAGVVSGELSILLVQIFGALWTLAFGVLLAYALVRHRLFGIDATLRITIRRGTIAAFFVAVFFTVAEIAQNYFTNEFDWLVGTVAAGLLLFALHPLQRIAQRLATATVPEVRSIEDMTKDQRLSLYADQARIAWADGSLTRKERLLLDHTRERLGIAIEDAQRLESSVIAQA